MVEEKLFVGLQWCMQGCKALFPKNTGINHEGYYCHFAKLTYHTVNKIYIGIMSIIWSSWLISSH